MARPYPIRRRVSKSRSSRSFRRGTRRTARMNLRNAPMRGGWRL